MQCRRLGSVCNCTRVPRHLGVVGNEVADSHDNDEPTVFLQLFVYTRQLLLDITRQHHPDKCVSIGTYPSPVLTYDLTPRYFIDCSAVHLRALSLFK